MSQAEVAVKITVDLRFTVSFCRTRVCPKLYSSEPWATNALEGWDVSPRLTPHTSHGFQVSEYFTVGPEY
jgi:hypothetical protein